MTSRSGLSDSTLPRSGQDKPRVLCDIGGTNARFAWQVGPDQPIAKVKSFSSAGYPSLEAALRAYVRDAALTMPDYLAVAIANPVDSDWVQMTNHSWSFSCARLQDELGLTRLLVLNDFTALALSLPDLQAKDVRQVGAGVARADRAMAVIGPGTGLGVSGLIPHGRFGWVAIRGEGGHATLASRSAREQAVLAWLDQRYGHASAERAVSGAGLADIRRALCAIDCVPSDELTAEQVSTAALEKRDACSVEALALMCAFLGTAAGNVALTLGALGGVYLAGGIVPRLGTFLDDSAFRERFERKGRFTEYLASVPTFVIQAAEWPTLAGVARALDAYLHTVEPTSSEAV